MKRKRKVLHSTYVSFTVGIWISNSWQVSPSSQDGLHKPISSAAPYCLPQEFLNPCDRKEKVFTKTADVPFLLLTEVSESSLGNPSSTKVFLYIS